MTDPKDREKSPPEAHTPQEERSIAHRPEEKASRESGGAALAPPAAEEKSSPPILEVNGLKVHFPVRSGVLQRVTGWVKAVDGVDFHVREGETLGLVGESGCGKTTLGRAVLRLIPPTAGEVRYRGNNLLTAGGAEMKRLRQEMQIIFQDPAGSLNPRMRIASIVSEPLRVHGVCNDKDELRERVQTLLERCGMPRNCVDRYPHEFSGGQRQRIGIARALALSPKFIVCDEPTSALDVSVQSQILNLLRDLQGEFGMSYLFISHDMAVIQHMCDRIAVMLGGKIVEEGPRERILQEPQKDYTKALLSAVPVADPRERRKRAASAA
ncbi:MAG: ABC transporter ATP-binding protein [Phycisphaeraceae bacterium]|nr:MAG: ABC transporter ATP-binding protein [Phycisphaeraceae bacterium]